MKKGVARLIFLVVFFIPVGWYLILQLFGSNNFDLVLEGPINKNCGSFDEILIVMMDDSVSIAKQNYLDRVNFGAEKREIEVALEDQNFFNCINQTDTEIVLLSEEGLWGAYSLSRDGVDLLLTELDILLLKKSYGKGTDR